MVEKDVYLGMVDYQNKAIAKPKPDKIVDTDVKGDFVNTIIDAIDSKKLDINTINSFTSISQSRDTLYTLIDYMGEDPIIASALEIYTADATETNPQGQIVWAQSDDAKILNCVNHYLEDMNVDKNAYGWLYSLIKYGDLYLRLYRRSEFEAAAGSNKKKSLNEDVILKVFPKKDKYVHYMEMVKNPAEVFNLTKLGKSYGYLRTHILSQYREADILNNQYEVGQFTNSYYKFNRNDVEILPATEYVHACLEDVSNRIEEKVSIINYDDGDLYDNGRHVHTYDHNYAYYDSEGIDKSASTDAATAQYNYNVRRGQSILYNTFKIWRELSMLENAVLLNRLTKSSIVRTVSIEVGDMEKNDVRNLLQRVKQMVEQKSAINVGTSLQEYTNPGPIENVIYMPTHEGIGAITTSQIGGDVEVGDLNDLDYWKKKLYASLGIPGQYLGDTDDNTGFNGGTSLSLISSRYAKNIKRIQNTFIQAITDAVNLMLLDDGLIDYIGKFTIRMQNPTTQEEKDRLDNMSSSISNVSSVMGLMDGVEDPTKKLEMLKAMLSGVLTTPEVISQLQEEIDRRIEMDDMTAAEGDFGGGDMNMDIDIGGGSSDFGGGDDLPAPSDLMGDTGGDELPTPADVMSGAAEGFESHDGELIQEDGDMGLFNKSSVMLDDEQQGLPTFADLGLDYNQVTK